jgi:tetratricopeptide (TPR) repeat protein
MKEVPAERKKEKNLLGQTSTNDSGWSHQSVTQLISVAEKYVGRRNYSLALETLSQAKKLEPNNNYIQAIIDRIHVLEKPAAQASVTIDSVGANSGLGSLQRLTYGNDTGPLGMDLISDEVSIPPEELQRRIRQLTTMAENFYTGGLYNSAFESLMKAYLLDPMSPYVLACENTVLPAWEFSRRKANSPSVQENRMPTPLANSSSNPGMEQFMSLPQDQPHASLNSPVGIVPEPLNGQSEQQQRVEALMKQKDLERAERERALWREASMPLRTFGEEENPKDPGIEISEPKKPTGETGLFSKLKLGKFLR